MTPSDVEKEVIETTATSNTATSSDTTTVPVEDGYDSGDSEFEITSEVAHGEEDDDSIAADEDIADEEEVNSLMKESEMSLNELLAAYGLSSNTPITGTVSASNDFILPTNSSGRSMRKRRQTFDTDQKYPDDTSTLSQPASGTVDSKTRASVEKEPTLTSAPKSTRRQEVKTKPVTEADQPQRLAVGNSLPSETPVPNGKAQITATNIAPVEVDEEIIDHAPALRASEVVERVKLMHEDEEDDDEEEETTPSSYSPSLWCQALAAGGSPPTYDSEADEDYHPSVEGGGDWRGEVRVGDEYQATVAPQPLNAAGKRLEEDSHLGYDCRLIWRPRTNDGRMSELDIIRYEQTYTRGPTSSIRQFPDDEEALFWLLQADFDTDEALQRLQFRPVQPSEILPFFEAWSEVDCTAFEKGFVTFNKNFRQIQQARLRHKTVAELVHFYYLWKKTARHDDFLRYYRREKKKPLHPGITDFMDCLVEEQQYSETHHLGNNHQTQLLSHNHPHHQHHPHGMAINPLHNTAANGTAWIDGNNHQSKAPQTDADVVTPATKRAAVTDIGAVGLQELIDDPEVSISPRLRVVDPPPSSSSPAIHAHLTV